MSFRLHRASASQAPHPYHGHLRLITLAWVALILATVSLAVNLLVVTVAPLIFEVPDELPALHVPQLLLVSIPPVLGNTIGFYATYRSYHPRALVLFLGPGTAVFLVLMVQPVSVLLAGGNFASFAVTFLVNVVPLAVVVPVLLSLRPDNFKTANPSGAQASGENDFGHARSERDDPTL